LATRSAPYTMSFPIHLCVLYYPWVNQVEFLGLLRKCNLCSSVQNCCKGKCYVITTNLKKTLSMRMLLLVIALQKNTLSRWHREDLYKWGQFGDQCSIGLPLI